MPQDVIALTKGSRYRVESMETRERTKVTKGLFRGYATIGTDDAIVVELDESHQEMKGKLRLLSLLYREAFATAAGVPVPGAVDALRLTSNLGQILFLAGVGAALWRANLAAGLSSSGVSGLVIASAGVGVLVLFEVVLLLAWFG